MLHGIYATLGGDFSISLLTLSGCCCVIFPTGFLPNINFSNILKPVTSVVTGLERNIKNAWCCFAIIREGNDNNDSNTDNSTE